MAADLEMVLKAKDEATSILSKVKGALGDVAKTAAGFAIGGGLSQLPGFLFDAAKGAAEDARSTDRVRQAWLNAHGDLGDFNDAIGELIDNGQQLAFSDDDVRDSLAILAAQTGDTEEATRRHLLALDLARGANIDVVNASKLLGKVTDENVTALSRMGITLKKGATEADVLAAVQQKFGGQAKAYAESTAGQFEQAQIRMGELKETLGAAVLPAFTAVVNFGVTQALPFFEKLGAKVGPALSDGFAAAKPIIQSAITFVQTVAIPAITQFVDGTVKPKFAEFKASAQQTFADFKAYWEADLRPALEAIRARIEDVIAFVREHWPEIKAIVQPVIEAIVEFIQARVKLILDALNIVINLLHGDFKGAWEAAKDLVKNQIDAIVSIAGHLGDALRALIPVVLSAAKAVGQAIIDGIVSAINGGLGVVSDIGSAILDGLKKLINENVIDKINRKLEFSFDLGPAGSIDIDPPDIPRLAKGGYVSRPMLAVVGDAPGGEWVLNRDQMQSVAGRGRGGDIHVHIGSVFGINNLDNHIRRVVRDAALDGAYHDVQFGRSAA